MFHNFVSDLSRNKSDVFRPQQAHTPSPTAEQATAIRRITDKRGQKKGEMCVDGFRFYISYLKNVNVNILFAQIYIVIWIDVHL